MSLTLTTEIWTPTMTPAKKQKTSPSSSLPNNGELREEDDWTKVKDPKEKKRIQNRVAQRTYRHRMKARLGELQARLESHEARRSQSVDALDGPGNATPNSFHSKTGDVIYVDGSASPSSHVSDTFQQTLQRHPQMPHQMMPHHPNLYEQPVEDPENSLFAQARGLLNSPPTSQPSPSPHGLLSPPTHLDPQQTPLVQLTSQPPPSQDPRAKGSENFMVDCYRFQSQLLDRLNSIQPDPTMATFPQNTAVQMSQAAGTVSIPAFTGNPTDTMDFAFDATSVDMWKPEDALKMQQHASPDSTYFSDLTLPSTTANSTTSGIVSDGASTSAPKMADKNSPLEERFECIMNQVSAAGFDSFDAMASAYYTQTFGPSSSLAHEQRLSRKRGLPQVIGDVQNASSGWSDWERGGFQEEILKTAEGMLAAEGGNARQRLAGEADKLLDAQNMGNAQGAAEAVLAMKTTVQEQLPNSFALTMALAADSRAPGWQRDRSNTALATTLLLNFSGRMPNDQLMRLVGACL